MAPKTKVTKQQIVAAGLELAREAGPGAINARAVARKLNCSTQPVFSNYAAMDELEKDVLTTASGLYEAHMAAAAQSEKHPPYKAMGLAYIDFARREPELFRWLFMRDRTGEDIPDGRAENRQIIRLIADKAGLDEDSAWRFHLEMWLFVHGVAAMLATGYINWDETQVSDMLTDMFEGLRARFADKGRK